MAARKDLVLAFEDPSKDVRVKLRSFGVSPDRPDLISFLAEGEHVLGNHASLLDDSLSSAQPWDLTGFPFDRDYFLMASSKDLKGVLHHRASYHDFSRLTRIMCCSADAGRTG
eukprot:2734792-Karenia_brevis.AAC.1